MNKVVVLGNAWHDENGKATGGKPGDQLQTVSPDYKGEVRFTQFYKSPKGWMVLRPLKPKHAKKLVKIMTQACNNPHIGYSQSDRYGIISAGTKTRKDCNCDCSSLVRQCIKEATGTDPGDFHTATEVDALRATGLFYNPMEYDDKMTLYAGDVLVTKIKGHTAIVVEGESRTNPYTVPNMPVTSRANAEKYNLKEYSWLGDYVRWVQWELCRVGYQQQVDACGGIDGQCGDGTVRCIAKFQATVGLPERGICGKQTRKALKKA